MIGLQLDAQEGSAFIGRLMQVGPLPGLRISKILAGRPTQSGARGTGSPGSSDSYCTDQVAAACQPVLFPSLRLRPAT